jgi:hypothetical protein
MSVPEIVIKKTAREFAIGESAFFGMRSFGDCGRVSYKDIKTLIKKGRKWAQWGDSAGYISKKTLLDEMMTVATPEMIEEKMKPLVWPEESDDDNGSVCFRVPHEYNEGECSDNCPHKPVEEEVESWVCGLCCGYFHATQAEYNDRPCCEKCFRENNK